MTKKSVASADRVAITSILVSVGDILINAIAAIITGSTVVFAQSLQGFADATTAGLLLFGVKRSRKKPTKEHPFGYGRELFFWVLLAGIMTLTISGGVALTQGFSKILNPADIDSPYIALGVLIFGVITNGYSLKQSLTRLTKGKFSKRAFKRIIDSSLIETKSAMLIDLTGTLSGITGLVALTLFVITGNGRLDGIGAVMIGLFTITGAVLLITDLRSLIIGRSPRPETIEKIRKTVLKNKNVQDVLDLRAVTMGSSNILAIIEVHFADDLKTDDIEKATDQIKDAVVSSIPNVSHVQVEAETPDSEILTEKRLKKAKTKGKKKS